MAKHIYSLTSLRGLAALVVVTHHFAYYALPQAGSILSSATHFFENGYLWLDFFFILSGFILTHVYLEYFAAGVSFANYRSYLFSRFARIYPLHFFIICAFVGLEILKAFLGNTAAFSGKFNLTALFANIFLLQAFDLSCPPLFWCNTYWNEPAWSISVEFVIYCVFPFLLFRLFKNKPKIDLLIYISTWISILFLIKFTRGNLDTIIGIPAIARCGLECVLGIITYKIYFEGNYRKFLQLNLVGWIAIIWIIGVMHTWDNNLRSLHDWFILPAFSLLILSISLKTRGLISKLTNSPGIIHLGSISYSIYMVHWFLQEVLKIFWLYKFHVKLGSNFTEAQVLITLGIFLAMVILTASLTYNFLEVPMRNYLKSTKWAKNYIYLH